MGRRMTLRSFLNTTKILLSIDKHELRVNGVIVTDAEWVSFRGDPIRWLLAASDEQADRVWRIIEARAS